MIAAQAEATVVGRVPKSVLRACLKASQEAGIVPASILRTSQRSAIVLGEEKTRPLYLRWCGKRMSTVEWATDPRLFSSRHYKAALRAVAELISDPDTRKRVVRPRGKTAVAVS